MGFIGDILGANTKTTNTVSLSAEQKKLTAQQVELGKFQKEELERQRIAQEQAFGEIDPSADAFDQFVAEQDFDVSKQNEISDELLQDQLDRIRAGGAATPEEIDLINKATEQAIAAGETDINRFLKFGLQQLRDELAPSLGLRPGDTPILDRGSRVAAEASRQQGQLVSGLRSQQFATQLGFPLQKAGVLGSLNQGQQGIQEQIRAFQASLKQGAFINRLQLAQGQTGAGLGLAGAGQPNLAPIFRTVSGTQKGSDPSQGFLNLSEATKNFSEAGSSVFAGVAGGSSARDLKNTQGQVDEAAILEALMNIPVDRWTYKGETQDHIGTFAEDFRDAFGVGNGREIEFIDAIGVLMAAVKALARRK